METNEPPIEDIDEEAPDPFLLRHVKKRLFLEAFRQTGIILAGIRAAGINLRTHYRWLERDVLYAAAFEDAKQEALEILEAEARRRALNGVEKPIYYRGERVGSMQEYSDTLLILLLKAGKPDVYRERFRDEIPDSDAALIEAGAKALARIKAASAGAGPEPEPGA